MTDSPLFESRLPVGSSASRIDGLLTSARAIATRWRCPPDSSLGRCDIRLRHVGIVFQNFNLFPTFTVEENVAWPLEFYGQSARRARTHAHELLAQVGVDVAAAGRRPAELSGGEQQRVAIARALVTSPTLLLADEPTGNLDSNTGQAILDLLRRLNDEQDVTVVMVTHSTFAATYGHRTIELRDGQIVREVQTPRAAGARVIPLFE